MKDELTDRLCELHRRLLLCFQGATGQAPPRRPRFFTPEWGDMDTVLDALERAKAPRSTPIMNEEVVERRIDILIQCAREREAASRLPDCIEGAEKRLAEAKQAVLSVCGEPSKR